MQAIILASGSRYRAELLQRLGRPMQCISADIDESMQAGESARQTAIRLARSKAETVAATRDAGIVLGSDQVPYSDDLAPGTTLGKPGHREAARRQLRHLSGRRVHFHTAICLIDIASGRRYEACDHTLATLRDLSNDEIDRYLELEPALDCAGSFKVEGLGIALFESIESRDPTALIGLPLIEVCRGLRQLDQSVP